MAATFSVLGQGRPLVKVVERLIGKLSYIQAFWASEPKHLRAHLRLVDSQASPQSGQGHVVAFGLGRAPDGGLPAPSVH